MLYRQECHWFTGECVIIYIRFYKNAEGHVLVLDDGVEPPEGYVEFDPTVEAPE